MRPKIRRARAEHPSPYEFERNIDFLPRRLDEERRPPTLAEIRERNREVRFFPTANGMPLDLSDPQVQELIREMLDDLPWVERKV